MDEKYIKVDRNESGYFNLALWSEDGEIVTKSNVLEKDLVQWVNNLLELD